MGTSTQQSLPIVIKLSEIEIKGFRVLVDISVSIHPLTVMIGPNGSGKTSLLDVFKLLKASINRQLQKTILEFGGLSALLTHTEDAPGEIEIGLNEKKAFIGDSIHYRFKLAPTLPGGYEILDEIMDVYPENPKIPPRSPLQADRNASLETMLAMDRRMDTEFEALRTTLSKIHFLDRLDVDQRAPIRLPQPLSPALYPESNGENLYSVLYSLKETNEYKIFFDQMIEVLQLAFPEFDHIELPPVGAGQINLTWYQNDLTVPLYPRQLSEGTLRFIWLMAVLLSPEPPPLVMIDEPEISLHPELLKILAGLLQIAATRTQLIVATHSSDLIRWLKSDEVLILDKIEGKTKFTWADDPAMDLERWLNEYTLSDLWLMGNLGGRP